MDVFDYGGGFKGYDIWIHRDTGDDVSRCPWLKKVPRKQKYICTIHEMKPKHCRDFPTSREYVKDTGCKGFD